MGKRPKKTLTFSSHSLLIGCRLRHKSALYEVINVANLMRNPDPDMLRTSSGSLGYLLHQIMEGYCGGQDE
jgi:hypothetical protein